MRRNFTLPELQAALDRMTEGALLQIEQRDYQRLFGENDAAVARLRHFAKGHACMASFADGVVSFRKLLQSAEGPPAGPDLA